MEVTAKIIMGGAEIAFNRTIDAIDYFNKYNSDRAFIMELYIKRHTIFELYAKKGVEIFLEQKHTAKSL